MNWIIIAILVMLSSSLMYLIIRKAKEKKCGVEFQNLAIFFVPTFIYFIYNIIFSKNMVLDLKYILIILIAAVCFSWLGNYFSLKAIEKAPNPGGSLMIQKSYTIMTTILSVFLFSSKITLKSIIGIIIVLLFMAFIIIEKQNNQKKEQSPWLIYTFLAFFGFGFLSLTITYLGRQGIESTVINFYICLIVSIISIIQISIKKVKIRIDKNNIYIMFGIGICSAMFNFCLTYGYQIAPNPGFISASNAASIAILTILYKIFFNDKLSKQKIIGVTGVLIGLIILFI